MADWKRKLGQEGILHCRSIAQAASDQKPCKGERENAAHYLKKEEADICLNCDRPTCSGSDGCFRKRKKKK